MPNQFLVEIHDYITAALTAVERLQQSVENRNDPVEKNFYSGQIEELQALRQYLTDHFDLSTQRYY